MPSGVYKHNDSQGFKKGNKTRLGIPMSPEHKQKISEANKGKVSQNKGKHLSEETKSRISKGVSGEKHWNWKGLMSSNKGNKLDRRQYENNKYKNLSEEKKKLVSWRKNRRNRLKINTVRELGTHTYADWELLKNKYNYTCPCCGLSEPFIGQKSKYLTEDHIIPLSKGGSDLIENIQPLCLSCNVSKNNKEKYYEQIKPTTRITTKNNQSSSE